MDTIVRIDMGAPGRPRARLEAVGGYAGLGGRSMVSTVLWREVPPDCHPMGPANKLVIAPGLLAGSEAAMAGRLTLGCKSPISARLAVADLGGDAACALGRLGLAAIVIEGRRVCADLWTVRIGPTGVSVERTDQARRQGRDRRPAGDDGAVAVIRHGANGNPGQPPRRSGLGDVWAVMELKGIAGLVLDAGTAPPARPGKPAGFASANRRLLRGLVRRFGGPATETCPRDGRAGCGLRCPDPPAEAGGGLRAGLPGTGFGPEDLVAAAALEDEAGGETPRLRSAGPDAAGVILACGGDIDRRAPEGRAEIARTLRLAQAALESTGYCSRLGLALLEAPKVFQALVATVNAFAGLTLGGEDLLALGRDILRKEQAFNRRAGFGPVHDRLPWFFRGDAIAPRLPLPRPAEAVAGQVSSL